VNIYLEKQKMLAWTDCKI